MQWALALLARWNAFPRRVRVVALAGVAVTAVASILAGLLAHPAQEALFPSGLHAEQLLEVQEQLAAWNVPFTPASDNVGVDAFRRSDLLLRLSLAGVPHEHLETTPEALSGVGALTPQAVIDAQTRAGLAGDVEAGLRGVAGVDDARAIVVPAEAAEFGDQTSRPASASVRLRLRPGARLSKATIDGIRAFVASSVAGLDASHVTLLDDNGVALEANDTEDASSTERALQSALDAAFGMGETIVRVRAEYATAAVVERVERQAPLAGSPIDRAVDGETFDDNGKRYRRQQEHDERGNESRAVVSETPPGTLARMTTAVFVDRARAADLAAIRGLAAATVGYDAKRGDVLTVEAVDFRAPVIARKDPWWLLYGAIVPLLPALALATGAVFAVRAAIGPLAAAFGSLAGRLSVKRAVERAGYEPARVRTALAEEPPHAAAAIISALPAATAAAVLELYPPHERDAIVRRMQRPHSPLVPGADEVVGRA